MRSEVNVHTASETPAARSLSSRHGFAYQVTHVEFKIGRGLGSVHSVDLQGWKRKGKGERDPEGGIGGERDPREWQCGLQKVLSGYCLVWQTHPAGAGFESG